MAEVSPTTEEEQPVLEAEVAEVIKESVVGHWDSAFPGAVAEDLPGENAGFIIQLDTGERYAVVVTLVEDGQ